MVCMACCRFTGRMDWIKEHWRYEDQLDCNDCCKVDGSGLGQQSVARVEMKGLVQREF